MPTVIQKKKKPGSIVVIHVDEGKEIPALKNSGQSPPIVVLYVTTEQGYALLTNSDGGLMYFYFIIDDLYFCCRTDLEIQLLRMDRVQRVLHRHMRYRDNQYIHLF